MRVFNLHFLPGKAGVIFCSRIWDLLKSASLKKFSNNFENYCRNTMPKGATSKATALLELSPLLRAVITRQRFLIPESNLEIWSSRCQT